MGMPYEYSGNTVGNTLGTLWECYGKTTRILWDLGTLWEYDGNTTETLWEYCGTAMGISWNSMSIQWEYMGIPWKYYGNTLGIHNGNTMGIL